MNHYLATNVELIITGCASNHFLQWLIKLLVRDDFCASTKFVAALMGSAGSPVLIGGTGDDVLVGSRGRDLLSGGIGSAHLGASFESELLISGTSRYAQGDVALQHILNEWSINQDLAAGVEGSRENFDIFS